MNENINIWDGIFKNNEWGKYPPIALIKFIAKNFYKISQRESVKILEIGSGTGANLWFCAREGFCVYGIEGSATAVDRMKKRFQIEKLAHRLADVKIGDYYDKIDEFEDGYFDAIIDVESLYCNSFIKSRDIVRKAFDKLRKDGVMFSMTFADGTYGLTGEEIDYHALMPTTGPMANMGFGRYVTREDIDKLYKLDSNEIVNVERLDLNLQNGEVIKEWIIEIKKK